MAVTMESLDSVLPPIYIGRELSAFSSSLFLCAILPLDGCSRAGEYLQELASFIDRSPLGAFVCQIPQCFFVDQTRISSGPRHSSRFARGKNPTRCVSAQTLDSDVKELPSSPSSAKGKETGLRLSPPKTFLRMFEAGFSLPVTLNYSQLHLGPHASRG